MLSSSNLQLFYDFNCSHLVQKVANFSSCLVMLGTVHLLAMIFKCTNLFSGFKLLKNTFLRMVYLCSLFRKQFPSAGRFVVDNQFFTQKVYLNFNRKLK